MRLRGNYDPPEDAKSSVLFACLAVAVRAGLSESPEGHRRLEQFREKFRQHGVDLFNEDDPRIQVFEKEVAAWLGEQKGPVM